MASALVVFLAVKQHVMLIHKWALRQVHILLTCQCQLFSIKSNNTLGGLAVEFGEHLH